MDFAQIAAVVAFVALLCVLVLRPGVYTKFKKQAKARNPEGLL